MQIKKLNLEGRRVPRVSFVTSGKSRVQQHEKDVSDINKIVERSLKTGLLPRVQAQALFADVSSVVDYQNAVELQLKAEEQFYALPAKIRNKFDNDPSAFLAFAAQEKGKEELIDQLSGTHKQRSKELNIPPENKVPPKEGGTN